MHVCMYDSRGHVGMILEGSRTLVHVHVMLSDRPRNKPILVGWFIALGYINWIQCHGMDFGLEQFLDPALLQSSRKSQALWEISALATLIKSDRIWKLKFKKQRACIPKQQKILQECPPGPRFWSNSKLCRNFFIRVGSSPPSGPWIPSARNALWTSEVVITEAWEAREILSQQTSSHIEPSGTWEEEKGRFLSFLPQYRHFYSHQSVAR